jgi:hypothetical protein
MAMFEEMVEIEKEEIVDGDADQEQERENGEAESTVSGFRDGVGEGDQGEGEERDNLYGCRVQERQPGEEKEEERDILYGRNTDQSSILTPSFRQYRARLELLERFGIDPPTRRPEFTGSIWEHGRTAA